MKKTHSKASLLAKRVKKVQGKAKRAGLLYFLGTLAMLAIVVALPVLSGTVLGDAMLPVLTFYAPIVALFDGGAANALNNVKALSAQGCAELLVALFYGIMVLVLLINVLRTFGKLGWLCKRKASYTYGFNRNAYAMDKLANRFTGSFATFVTMYLLIYLVSGTAQLGMYAYVGLGAGAAIHLLAGLIGGKVTLFTMDDNIEEEPREFGLFVYFVRNVLQMAVVAAILYFFVPQTTFGAELPNLVMAAVNVDVNALLNIPVLVELVAWLCIFVLIRHAAAETEFNRDCIDGTGMKNFRLFSFLTALCLAAIIVLPMVGVVPEAELNMNVVYAAVAAFVGFLVDCIIKSRRPKEKKLAKKAQAESEEVGVEDYLRENAEIARYKNTII